MAERKYLNALRRDIQAGLWQDSGELPTMHLLAERYVCSLSSIRQAVDVLKEEGVLYTVSGKGTFLTSRPQTLPQERTQIIGAVTLSMNFQIVENLKDELCSKGWMIVNYNAWSDHQALEKEQEFLDLACRNRFAGVFLYATSFAPTNRHFYEQMRRKGLKIVHLSLYHPEIEHESYVLCDHQEGGRLAVATMKERGVSQLISIQGNLKALYLPELEAGIAKTATALNMSLLPPIVLQQWREDADWIEDQEQLKCAEIEKWGSALESLPSGSGLLCYGPDIAYHLRRFLNLSGVLQQKKFQILSVHNIGDHFADEGGIFFDYEEQSRLAIDYLCDSASNALTCFQRFVKPHLLLKHQ